MDEMSRYIFKNLRYAECAMYQTVKGMRRQRSFNQAILFFAVGATVQLINQNRDISEMRREIKELKTEVKELKSVEGD